MTRHGYALLSSRLDTLQNELPNVKDDAAKEILDALIVIVRDLAYEVTE